MTTSPPLAFETPYLRNFGQNKTNTILNAVTLIKRMCAATGRPDLGQTDLLDIGCGVRFSQAILTHDLPLKSYRGVDVFGEMVTHLKEAVNDPRFQYHHHDVHNALYNEGTKASIADVTFPVPDESADLICGFSLFTHLAPTDYRLMLEQSRRAARDGAQFYFTTFIDEMTPGGLGFIDNIMKGFGLTEHPTPVEERPDYIEGNPDVPLQVSLYSRAHVMELIDGSGWEVEEIHDPFEWAQHQVVCRAV